MKKSLKSKYQLLMVVCFALIVLQSALILITVYEPSDLAQRINSIQLIVTSFFLILIIYFIVLFYYVPLKYEQALKEVYQIIDEISEGKYEINLELKTHNQPIETSKLIQAMQRMMNIVIRFDSLKADKIYEHHQRLQHLINMIPQGCMIVSIFGEITYLNDFVKNQFPEIAENMNILENLLPEYIEDNLKPIIADSLKKGSNIHDKVLKIESVQYKLNSSIVRNRKNQPIGAIYIIVKA